MKFFKKLAIDLGTANSLVWEAGKGVVLNEPTIVAVGIEDRKVLAVGNEAKKMLGKTPEYIEVIRPLEEGVIADYEVTEAMLRYFLQQVMELLMKTLLKTWSGWFSIQKLNSFMVFRS